MLIKLTLRAGKGRTVPEFDGYFIGYEIAVMVVAYFIVFACFLVVYRGIAPIAVCTLRNVVDGDNFFRLINRFVSSVKRSERHLEILFPNDMLIIDSDSVSAEESMAQAHQTVESIKAKTDTSIQQTLIFPHVEQFNNNPDKVINQIKNK